MEWRMKKVWWRWKGKEAGGRGRGRGGVRVAIFWWGLIGDARMNSL